MSVMSFLINLPEPVGSYVIQLEQYVDQEVMWETPLQNLVKVYAAASSLKRAMWPGTTSTVN